VPVSPKTRRCNGIGNRHRVSRRPRSTPATLPASRTARIAHANQPAQIKATRSPAAGDPVVAAVNGAALHHADHTAMGLPNAVHNSHGGATSRAAARRCWRPWLAFLSQGRASTIVRS
jgi:hypothetical protein